MTLTPAGQGFGSNALRVNGRVFAMPRYGGLVLKLPAERVAELIAGRIGTPFTAGTSRAMTGWVVVSDRAHEQWGALALESYRFVNLILPRGRTSGHRTQQRTLPPRAR